MNNRFKYFIFRVGLILSVAFGAVACSAQGENLEKHYKEIYVHNCSFVDEYFDYCRLEHLEQYRNAFKNIPANFNKSYVLITLTQESPLIHGIAVVSKKTGDVYTMLYMFHTKKPVSYQIESNRFCIDGDIYSHGSGDGREGVNCFEFDNEGFKLLSTNQAISKESENSKVSPEKIYKQTGIFKPSDSNKEISTQVPLILADDSRGSLIKIIDTAGCGGGTNEIIILPTNTGLSLLSSFVEENGEDYWYLISKSEESKATCINLGLGAILHIDKNLKLTVKVKEFKEGPNGEPLGKGVLKTHHYQVEQDGSARQID